MRKNVTKTKKKNYSNNIMGNLSLIQRKSTFNSPLCFSGGNEWLVFWWW